VLRRIIKRQRARLYLISTLVLTLAERSEPRANFGLSRKPVVIAPQSHNRITRCKEFDQDFPRYIVHDAPLLEASRLCCCNAGFFEEPQQIMTRIEFRILPPVKRSQQAFHGQAGRVHREHESLMKIEDSRIFDALQPGTKILIGDKLHRRRFYSPSRCSRFFVIRVTCGSLPLRPWDQSVEPQVKTAPPRV